MCGEQFSAASPGCQGCIAANLNLPIEEIVATCEGGGPALAYGGHNGLMLLSRHPLTDTDHMSMTSTVTQRSVLRADVEVPGQGPVSVYCTHLAADLSGALPYRENEDYSSYQEEQAAQIQATLGWVGQHTNHDAIVILGDFNTGPAVGDSAAELPENFDAITDAGWEAPFASSQAPLCTFCADNRVQGGGADSKLEDGSTGVLIDHALVPSAILPQVTHSARAFDQLQPITVTDSEGNQEQIDLHLSDHYGVEITITP
jgi:endonuclease/exonuclease/phosphatase family metal-dependent hydrolase